MRPFALGTVVRVWIPVGIGVLIVVAAWFGGDRESAPVRVPPPAARPAVRPIESDPAASEARRQPGAVVANDLVVPWSTIRTEVTRGATDDDAAILGDELAEVVETLRRTRRAPDRGIPLVDTLAELERLEGVLTREARWADNERVQASLRRHRAVLERYSQAR